MELDIELWRRHGSARDLLGRASTEGIVWPQRDQSSTYPSLPDVSCSYISICTFGVPKPPVFSNCCGVLINATVPNQKFVSSIAEVGFFVLSYGTLHKAVRVGPVKLFLFIHLIEECNCKGASMKVPDSMVNVCLDFGFMRTTDHMNVGMALVFVEIAHLCKVKWHALRSHNCFSYEYKTEKLPCSSRSSSMVHKFAGGTEEKVAGTKSVRPIYQEKFTTCGVSFEFDKAAWLQYSEKGWITMSICLLVQKTRCLTDRSHSAASVVGFYRAPLAASVVGGGINGYDDQELEASMGLENVEWVRTKRHLHDIQECCRAEIREAQ